MDIKQFEEKSNLWRATINSATNIANNCVVPSTAIAYHQGTLAVPCGSYTTVAYGSGSLCDYLLSTTNIMSIVDNTSTKLVDNLTKNFGSNETLVWTQSKYESEYNAFSTGSFNIIVPDLFDTKFSVTPTGTDIMNRLGVNITLESNHAATTTIATTLTGDHFNYNDSLIITNTSTNIVFTVRIHPEARQSRCDFNILVWNSILRCLGKKSIIKTKDKNLLSSADTFSNNFIN
jgi:hypothetical protein